MRNILYLIFYILIPSLIEMLLWTDYLKMESLFVDIVSERFFLLAWRRSFTNLCYCPNPFNTAEHLNGSRIGNVSGLRAMRSGDSSKKDFQFSQRYSVNSGHVLRIFSAYFTFASGDFYHQYKTFQDWKARLFEFQGTLTQISKSLYMFVFI